MAMASPLAAKSLGGEAAHLQVQGLYAKLEPLKVLERFVSQKLRPDGRGFGERRAVTVKRWHGAELITLGGGTQALGAVEAVVSDEPGPLLAFEVSCGTSARDAAWARSLNWLLDEVFAEATLPRGDLRVDEQRAWRLVVRVTCVADCGGLVDACILAATAALRRAALPAFEAAAARPVPLRLLPLPLTCAVAAGEAVLADPTPQEEALCALVTVVCGARADDAANVALLKLRQAAGGTATTPDALDAAVRLAFHFAPESLEVVSRAAADESH
ncbi:hypothetical protein M885DRAFT_610928 [Pelagophyceae sp. CCMP2097]|nr:hypothetical protein M885DRAFT_610928 [Pelagophyceae sp. CCMP2097]